MNRPISENEPLLSWLKNRYSNGYLAGNLRLLLTSKVECARREAQGCLRTILSRQPNSETKVPRFSAILEHDLTTLVSSIAYPIVINLRCIKAKGENTAAAHDTKTLIDILETSPDYEIIGRQNALDHLLVNLSNPASNQEFLNHHGIEKIARFLDKCLDERCALIGLFPLALAVLMKSLNHTLGKVDDESTQQFLLFSLLRGLYVFLNRSS